MNKNDYINQVDSIGFSPDLEAKLIDGVALAKPRKKRYTFPLSLAACIVLVAVIVLPSLKAKNGVMTDGSAVETQDFKDKTTLYSTSTAENYLADAAGGVTADIALLMHRLILTHENGEGLTQTEYEAECERLQNLGYEVSMWEYNGGPCIRIFINPYHAEHFTDTDYRFEFILVTE